MTDMMTQFAVVELQQGKIILFVLLRLKERKELQKVWQKGYIICLIFGHFQQRKITQ